ncbi:SDR family oxidoreductase [Olivibacter sp. SDN3]|uniref:SDR family oxidoreductase n=1 Tax=Olivibacter sp. SDN3 TaxID=2764720 RepID=UPI0016518B65|nr:SDR family oxidoreductase [Olivibacter sp. SDN3]QNL51458.1 SDR family oxidoreductase [Olivibacter sp. SDN3]
MSNSIKGRYALITGATRGIGRSITAMLAKEGCNLMIAARGEKDLKQLRNELINSYPECMIKYFVVDCGDQEQVKELAEAAANFSATIDILINNVGLFNPSSFLEESETTFADHMAVNVFCTHYLSVFFGRKMCKKKAGHIFNVGSVAGKMPFAKAASYSVTKYAVHGLTTVLRQEFGAYGVKVTEIIPGSTYTSSWEGIAIPEERFVAVDDIAASVRACLQMSAGANVDEIVIRPVYGEI